MLMEIFMLCLIVGIGLGLISFERKVVKHLDGIEDKINQLQNSIDRDWVMIVRDEYAPTQHYNIHNYYLWV